MRNGMYSYYKGYHLIVNTIRDDDEMRIPDHSGHPIRFSADSDSVFCRTEIPFHSGHSFRKMADSDSGK